MNTYILTKGRNFKTFLKENYAVALFGQLLLIYYKNVEHKIEHVLIVLMEWFRVLSNPSTPPPPPAMK